MLKIVKFPSDILRERMPEFEFNNPIMDPVQLEKDMIEAMFANEGMGLSANQVGIKTRVFVMGSKLNPDLAQACFNPIVVENTNEIDDLSEGCLSFPGIYVKVKRPKKIRMTIKVRNSRSITLRKEIHVDNAKIKKIKLKLD